MKSTGRFLMAVLAVVMGAAGVWAGPAPSARAGLDNQMSLVDGFGRTLTVQQWDTFLDGVFPLDRNRLTREWFHSGRALYSVVGPAADDFEGVLELGYQVGFPWSLGVGLNFSYQTPNILLDDASLSPLNFDLLGSVITPNLFPGATISADLGQGPGVTELTTLSQDVTGPKGGIAVANGHGSVTGAAGGVLLRPFARLNSSAGDSVTTYGEPWDMR